MIDWDAIIGDAEQNVADSRALADKARLKREQEHAIEGAWLSIHAPKPWDDAPAGELEQWAAGVTERMRQFLAIIENAGESMVSDVAADDANLQLAFAFLRAVADGQADMELQMIRHPDRFWIETFRGVAWMDLALGRRVPVPPPTTAIVQKPVPANHDKARLHNADTSIPIVDVAKHTVTFNGRTYDISSLQALRWLAVLVGRPGEYIAAKDLSSHNPDLLNVRTDKLCAYLPAELQERIESKTGAGSRWRTHRT